MLGFALKDGSSHFLNMKHLLTSSLNNKIVSYCHFTKRLVVLPIRSNVNQFIFLVSATVKYRACFVLLILMFVFCSKLKKKKVGCPTQKTSESVRLECGHTGPGTLLAGFVPCGQLHVSYASALFLQH